MARQTGMKGLQLWCRNVTQGYEGVEIVNMNKSFRDGLAFCAIIHRYRPELIPYDTLVKGDVARNNTLAFKVADEELDIAPLLDVEDMVAMEIPDKLSIATYLITYYNYFKDKQPAVTGNAPTNKTTPPTNENSSSKRATPVNSVAVNHGQKETTPTPSKPLPPPSQTTPTNDEAVNKLSRALANIQHKETDSGYHGNKPVVPALVKKPRSTSSLDHTPSVTPPSINKSTVRGRKQKFIEPVATETNKPTTAPPPKPPSQRKSFKHKTVSNETCEQCQERVFIMQRLCAEGHTYHRQCFKCVRCDVGLQSKSYEYDIQGDMFYCRQHFQEINRSRSIKRNMAAQGVVDNEVGVVTKKEQQEEWDIIPTPPPSQAATPFEFPVDKEEGMKGNLPSLLSQLAHKKQELQRAESHPLPRPQGEHKSPILPPSPVKSTNKVQTPPTSPNKTSPTSNKTISSIETTPTSPCHGNKYPLSPSKSYPVKPPPPATVSNKRPHPHTNKSHPSGNEPHPPNKPQPYKPRPLTTVTNKLDDKQEVNEPRQLQDKPRPLQDKPRPLQDKPRPPKPVRQGSKKINMTQMMEHYEMSPEFYKSNKEAREVLRERYDIPDAAGTTPGGGEVEECNPYEIPVPMVTKVRSMTELEVKQPNKPARQKRAGLVTIHKGDTWVRPYAVSPLHGGITQELVKPVINADKPVIKTNKPKPARPAPPVPFVRRPTKPVADVSPYAVSSVSTSFANNELKRKRAKQLREYKRQIDRIDADRKQLEMRGVELEQVIREGEEGGEEESEQQEVLMEQWFSLVNDKDQLVRRESELVYMIRDIELIEEKETLEIELRQRLAKDSSSKSQLERAEEEAMMEELTQLVMRRDQLMWQLDEDKTRDDEVDQLIDKVMK